MAAQPLKTTTVAWLAATVPHTGSIPEQAIHDLCNAYLSAQSILDPKGETLSLEQAAQRARTAIVTMGEEIARLKEAIRGCQPCVGTDCQFCGAETFEESHYPDCAWINAGGK